ncbi:hypothetical protein [Flavobacterium gilvum]|uniref:LysM domain-containing protein n=1 Tax=Flavobacterium gilvum TaxID=1492737 RepID=A0AAC9I3C4_9FLAO|nr:hypothetical protein [Flavobacterium gilvum]AOW09526.1 hypothetical protein EM308_08440 [Flavobacterium gilvum]KFC60033.1 hypothetical protein FEM08_12120 [Flavobacterium gilvum]
MKNITVLSGQSLFDIAIQYTGAVINAYTIAFANGKSITDSLTVGEMIVIPDGLTIAKKELDYLTTSEILPASDITKEQQSLLDPDLGIGWMIIEETFIVS